MKSTYAKNVFDSLFFEKLKNYCVSSLDGENVFYSEEHGRYYSYIFLPDDLSDEVIKISRKYTGIDTLDIVYAQIVKYQIKNNSIPRLDMHKDNLYCTHTVDISIDSNVEWPLVVEGNAYPGESNSAVFLKGDEEMHGRPEFPSKNEESFVIALFVHMAPEGDKYLEMSKKLNQLPIEKRQQIINNMKPIMNLEYYRNKKREEHK